MSHNYIVSAHRPTAVTDSVMGNFTAPNELNLIIAKVHNIEVFIVTSDGLKLHSDLPVNGRLMSVRLFRPAHEVHISVLCFIFI